MILKFQKAFQRMPLAARSRHSSTICLKPERRFVGSCNWKNWASFVAQLVKNQPAMWEISVLFLGWEDPLEKGKATQSSILAWRLPLTIAPGVTKSWTWLSDFHLSLVMEKSPVVTGEVCSGEPCRALSPLSVARSGWFHPRGQRQKQLQASARTARHSTRGQGKPGLMTPSWTARKLLFQKPLAHFPSFLFT